MPPRKQLNKSVISSTELSEGRQVLTKAFTFEQIFNQEHTSTWQRNWQAKHAKLPLQKSIDKQNLPFVGTTLEPVAEEKIPKQKAAKKKTKKVVK